jgi:hypothetical protein
MRIYIIGNDGITLCREAPAVGNPARVTRTVRASQYSILSIRRSR